MRKKTEMVRFDVDAVKEACKSYGIRQCDISAVTSISAANMTRIFQGEKIRQDTAKEFWCGIDRCIRERGGSGISIHQLRPISMFDYPLIGLCPDTPRLNIGEPFQSFEVTERNPVVSYLWSELNGSWIKAKTLEDDREGLFVEFDNRGQFPGNVSIHPQDCLARIVDSEEEQWLTLMAQSVGEVADRPIHLGIRIGDRNLQQWALQFSFRILEGTPTRIDIDLSNTGQQGFRKFHDAGDVDYDAPELDTLTTLVIEFGRASSASHRPGVGTGRVELWDVRLTKDV